VSGARGVRGRCMSSRERLARTGGVAAVYLRASTRDISQNLPVYGTPPAINTGAVYWGGQVGLKILAANSAYVISYAKW